MQIDKTKMKELFIAGSLNPLLRCCSQPKLLGYAWVYNLFVCKMAIGLSALYDKAKKEPG